MASSYEYYADVVIDIEMAQLYLYLTLMSLRKKMNCMLNSSTVDIRHADETIVLPPGQFIPVDKQCQLLYSSSSFYCAVC